MVAAQGMADKNGIVPRRIEGPIRLVAQRETRERLAVLEGKGVGADEVPRLHNADIAGREMSRRGGIGRRSLDIVGHSGQSNQKLPAEARIA